VERENELSSKWTVNYLWGRVIPEDLLSILKIENPSPEGALMVFLLLRQPAGIQEYQKFQITNHNDQNSKFQNCFGH
jgi:hypothetical protein